MIRQEVIDYVLQRLSPQDQADFEEKLLEDASLMDEVEVCRIQLITDYLEDSMGRDVLSDFDKALASDPSLRDEVAIQRNLVSGLEKNQDLQDFKEKVSQVISESQLSWEEIDKNADRDKSQLSRGNARSSKNILKTILFILLGGLLLYFIFTNIVGKEPTETPVDIRPQEELNEDVTIYAQLANQYVEKNGIPGFDQYRNFSGSALGEALEDLNNSRYKDGITKLNTAILSDSTNADLKYYLGLAYFHDGQYARAIPHLLSISLMKNSYLFAEQAEWLLCLAYLYDGDINSGEVCILSVSKDTSHDYSSSALLLSKDIGNMNK